MKLTLKQEVPMKYLLSVHQFLPNYPTHDDFIFDVISHIIKSNQQRGDIGDLKFSVKTLKYIFGDNLKSEDFIDRIKAILSDLVKADVLVKNGEFLMINRTELDKYYSSN